MKIYNWAIIGPGIIAHKFAKSMEACKNAKLFAVSSRAIDRAKTFADLYNIPNLYEDTNIMCENEDIDIVYIANINTAHKDAVLTCLNAGKNVLCEKPIAMNETELNEMIKCAKENDVFLMEATWTFFLPVIVKVKEWIIEGKIGEIRRISADFGYCMDNKKGREYEKSLGGGALLDLGPYSIGVPYSLLGKEPTSIVTSMYIGEEGVDEVTNVILNFEDGVCISSFCAIATSVQSDMQITGTLGSIIVPNFYDAEKAELYVDGKLEDSFVHNNNGLGFKYEIDETMQCITAGKKESDAMSLSLSLRIAKIFDEIRKQGSLIYDNE